MVDEVDAEAEAASEKYEDTTRTTGVSGIVAGRSDSDEILRDQMRGVDQRRMVEYLGDDDERFVERPGFTDDLDVMKSPKTR
jgi:hypothetical protein